MGNFLFKPLLNSVGNSIPPPPAPPPPSRPFGRRKTALIAITAVLVVVCVVAIIWRFNSSSPPSSSAPYKFQVTALDAHIISGLGGDYLEVTVKGETTSFQVTAFDPDGKQMGSGVATPDLKGEAKVNLYAGYPHKTGIWTIELSRYLTEDYRKEIYIQ